MTTLEICDDYYSLFQTQGTDSITTDPDEYAIAVNLLRRAIRKWARTDGELWRELDTSLSDNADAVKTVTGATIAAPTDMRKPPAKVTFLLTDDTTAEYSTVEPHKSDASSIWFTGGANTGFTMHIGADLLTTLTDADIEYGYVREPRIPASTADAAMKIDMSDPDFAVHYMLALRYGSARNGFGYQTSMKEAKEALANMRLENSAGTFGSDNSMLKDSGWGMGSSGYNDIRL